MQLLGLPAPIDLQVGASESTASSVALMWEPPEESEAILLAYAVKYRETEESCTKDNSPLNCNETKYKMVSERCKPNLILQCY